MVFLFVGFAKGAIIILIVEDELNKRLRAIVEELRRDTVLQEVAGEEVIAIDATVADLEI